MDAETWPLSLQTEAEVSKFVGWIRAIACSVEGDNWGFRLPFASKARTTLPFFIPLREGESRQQPVESLAECCEMALKLAFEDKPGVQLTIHNAHFALHGHQFNGELRIRYHPISLRKEV